MPWSLVRNEIAVVIPVPKDRRSVFVVPWGGDGGPHRFTYIGTTDTDYDGPIDDPQITAADVAYLLRAINGASTTKITEADILGTWAGLRPLVAAAKSERTADLSRRHSVHTSPGGVVTVTGGKLTTYRRMAADAVDQVVEGRRPRRPEPHQADRACTAPTAGTRPTSRRTSPSATAPTAATVAALEQSDPRSRKPLIDDLPVLARRGRVRGARRDGAHASTTCCRAAPARACSRATRRPRPPTTSPALMAAELGWTDDERERQVAHYRALVAEERLAGGLPETALDALSHPPA